VDRRERIKELFHAVVNMTAADRAAFLRAESGDDDDVVREVESLIQAHLHDDSFIQPPDFDAVSRILRDEKPEALIGRRVGAYELRRLIGSGGMANVFLAGRVDGQFERDVAVKLIKRGMDTDEILRRFRQERQTLAALDHPNVAKLLDGGATDDGRPFLIMEHVDGRPIDEYCFERQLNTRQRLELFLTVCAAVHYAHQNLVVHRDLKPGNILVTKDGIPKLLDFGIAKLLDPSRTDAITRTESTVRLMTPDYASPEQVRRQRVTIATDVYSLGVILFEMLTGQRPYRLEGTSQRALEHAICDTEPTRPSTAAASPIAGGHAAGTTRTRRGKTGRAAARTTGAGAPARASAVRRELAGDLDTIILTALRKEPGRRYPSVRDLSEDIRRYLQGLPIQARKDTFAYRTAKFVRRNRAAVAAVVTIFAVLVTALVTTSWQRDVAEHNLERAVLAERDAAAAAHRAVAEAQAANEARRQAAEAAERAAAEARSANAVVEFMVGLFKTADPDEALGRELSARDMLERGAEEMETALAGQPQIQATLLEAIGRVYQNLGDLEEARRRFDRALELSDATHGRRSVESALILNSLGVLRQAQGDYDDSERLHSEALDIRRALLPADHVDVAASLSNLGSLRRDQGRMDEAIDLLTQALEIRRRVHGLDHPEVMASLNNLTGVYYHLADYERARRFMEELVEIARRALGPEHTYVALYLNNLGLIVHTQGDYASARAYYAEALAMRRKLLGDDHRETAITLNNLGGLAIDSGDPAAAEPYFRESLELHQRLHGDEHPNTANAYNNLGLCLRLLGRTDEAEPLLKKGLEIRERILPPGHPSTSASLLEIGELKLASGEYAEAEALMRRSVEMREASLPPDHWRTAEARSALGACLVALGRLSEAGPLLTESYAAIRDARGEQSFGARLAAERLDAWMRASAQSPMMEND